MLKGLFFIDIYISLLILFSGQSQSESKEENKQKS